MKKINFESVLKRILSTSYVTGVCGGLFVSALKSLESSKSVSLLVLQLFILIIVGTGISAIARSFKQKRLAKTSPDFKNEDLKIADQNSFFIALIVMVIAHFINSDMSEWNQFSAVLLTGGVFILSMVNGHLDISTYAARYLLVIGIIPLLLSFILGYSTYGNQELVTVVWIFGFMGLLSFLLILSNSTLNSQLFSSRNINVANRQKIKIFNFGTVLILFALCIVAISARKILTVSGAVIKSLISVVYRAVEKFTLWLLNDPEVGKIAEESNKERPAITITAGENTVFNIAFIAIIVLALVFAVSVIVLFIKKQKLAKNKTFIQEYDEFDENSEIIREKLHLHLRKGFSYSLKEFDEIKDVGDKTRYLYGFIIERLYHKKVRILKSDTPDEIMNKVFECDNGRLLENLGFKELTEKYRRVRYGGKKIQFEGDMGKMAEAYERVILNFHNEEKKRK